MFGKLNVLDIEAKYHRSEKIHKVWTKSLSVCTLTKSFASLVSMLLPFQSWIQNTTFFKMGLSYYLIRKTLKM